MKILNLVNMSPIFSVIIKSFPECTHNERKVVAEKKVKIRTDYGIKFAKK